MKLKVLSLFLFFGWMNLASASGPVSCYREALKQTSITASQRVELCAGASSLAPVACYMDALRQTDLDVVQRIALCRYATN